MSQTKLCVAVLLALCAVSATALRPTSCTKRVADFEYFQNAACYRVQELDAANTDPITVTFNISKAFFDNAEVEFFFWNIDEDANFAGTSDIVISYLGASGSPAAISMPATVTGTPFGSSFSIPLATNADLASVSFMTVEIALSNTHEDAGAPVGMVASFVPATASNVVSVNAGGSGAFNVRADLLTAQNLQFELSGDFIDQQYIVESAKFVFSASDTTTLATITDVDAQTTLGATMVDTSEMNTFVMSEIARQTAQPTVSFAAAPTAYDLATFGPFFAGAVQFDVTEYPTVDPNEVVGVTDETIFRVNLPALWQTVQLPRSDVGATATAGPASVTFALAMNPATAAGVAGSAPVTAARTFSIADPTAGLDSFFLLSPLQKAVPDFVFVKATPTGGQVNFAVEVDSVPGECSSYVDCRKNGGDAQNPSTRGGASANDADRFVHCAVLPGAADPTTVQTSCIECISDCDCGAGQYCHKDAGACNRDGATDFYTCDAQSRRSLGLCVAKDPSGDVIGKQCRTVDPLSTSAAGAPSGVNAPTTVQGLSYMTDSFSQVSAANALPLVEAPAVVDIKGDTGIGFCGGARFFSPENNDVSTGDVDYGFGARTILWQGFCYNSVCMECLGDTNACNGAQQCIDGALADTIVVDGTSRTFSHNALAGVMLAVLFMVILVQLCVCCVILQRRRYRKQDRSEAGKDQKEKTVFA